MSLTSYEITLRKPYTPGWEKDINTSYGLPIKKAGKIIHIPRQSIIHDDLDEDDEETNELVDNENPQIDSEFDNFDSTKQKRKEKLILSVNSFHEDLEVIKQKIAEICTFTCADPHTSLKRKSKNESVDQTSSPHLIDLFAYFTHNDSRVAQIAILSALLVFKDIIPGYMIRSPGETDSKLVLKKETKRIMDYDQSLLQAYQRYLNILDNMISTGFGDLHKESSSSDHSDRWELGYNALKCQCELLRSVPHFNLRSKLITNIVNYACQPNSQISTLCCDCLIRIIGNDVQGDLSFDIVRSIAKNLIIHKHDVPERVLHVLEKVKIRIHEDVVKNIRKQAKKDRRKRKSDGDGVEASMLETEGINQTQVKIKQADCLREMTLIYFRILKEKVRYNLLPVALEGLSRLTHYINIDTVMDLLSLLKKMIETSTPSVPPEVRLHCIYCALRTLSGPGQELEMDGDIFISKFGEVIRDLNSESRWDIVFQTAELCLLHRRETHKHYIIDIVSSLIHNTCFLRPSTGCACLGLIHCILVHYPVLRSEILSSINQMNNQQISSQSNSIKPDDEVGDMAMQGLIDKKSENTKLSLTLQDHMFWILALLKHSPDVKYRELIRTITGNNIMPIEYSVEAGKPMTDQVWISELDSILEHLSHPHNNLGDKRIKNNINDDTSKSAKTKDNAKRRSTTEKFSKSFGSTSVNDKIDYRKKKSNRNFSQSKRMNSNGKFMKKETRSSSNHKFSKSKKIN